jgi:Fe-S cluster biogenesis protein NfuA
MHPLYNRVNLALDTVRPHLAVDGGNVEIVEITDDNVLKIKWLGACEGCNMSWMTMRAGIEQTIKNQVPEIISVEAVNGVQSTILQ